jgi:hypothetical protein
MTMRILAAIGAAAIMGTAATAAAQPRQPLPVFSVVDAGGAEVASANLTSQERWLLIYMSPECSPCELLMKSLRRWTSPEMLARTVIVVAGTPEGARGFIEQHAGTELAGITWYADPEGKAAAALKVKSSPALAGIRAGQINWRLAGVLNEPGALQSIVRTWVEDRGGQ